MRRATERYGGAAMAGERGPALDQRILDAAVDVVADRGVEGFSVDAVAARAGVARTTVYRRWSDRYELLVAAVRHRDRRVPTPNTGDLRRDLFEVLSALAQLTAEPDAVPFMLAVLRGAATDPRIAEHHRRLADEHERPVLTVLQLARARGELPEGVDLEAAVDAVVGPLLARVLLRRQPVDDRVIAEHVSLILGGLLGGPDAGAADGAAAAAPAGSTGG